MATVAGDLADKMGLDPWVTPEEATQITWSRDFVFNQLGNGDIAPPSGPSPFDNYPWLHYQSPKYFGDDPGNKPRIATHPSFLQFRSVKDIGGMRLDPRLASPIRLYMNPGVNVTPVVAAELCRDFIAARGFFAKRQIYG